MTDAERLLWSNIRRKQLNGRQFYRQKIIGSYIVDFYCHAAKLVIEIDGGQHYSEKEMKKDRSRDEFIRQRGLRILRFSDRDIFINHTGVMQQIWENL